MQTNKSGFLEQLPYFQKNINLSDVRKYVEGKDYSKYYSYFVIFDKPKGEYFLVFTKFDVDNIKLKVDEIDKQIIYPGKKFKDFIELENYLEKIHNMEKCRTVSPVPTPIDIKYGDAYKGAVSNQDAEYILGKCEQENINKEKFLIRFNPDNKSFYISQTIKTFELVPLNKDIESESEIINKIRFKYVVRGKYQPLRRFYTITGGGEKNNCFYSKYLEIKREYLELKKKMAQKY